MSALEQLREEASKREEKLGKQIEEKEGDEKEIKKVRE
jgi:hypothetical protein